MSYFWKKLCLGSMVIKIWRSDVNLRYYTFPMTVSNRRYMIWSVLTRWSSSGEAAAPFWSENSTEVSTCTKWYDLTQHSTSASLCNFSTLDWSCCSEQLFACKFVAGSWAKRFTYGKGKSEWKGKLRQKPKEKNANAPAEIERGIFWKHGSCSTTWKGGTCDQSHWKATKRRLRLETNSQVYTQQKWWTSPKIIAKCKTLLVLKVANNGWFVLLNLSISGHAYHFKKKNLYTRPFFFCFSFLRVFGIFKRKCRGEWKTFQIFSPHLHRKLGFQAPRSCHERPMQTRTRRLNAQLVRGRKIMMISNQNLDQCGELRKLQ